MSALVQNTEEWLEFRKDKLGASDCPVIMGVSPWKTPYQLWQEKLGVEKSYCNPAMQRGHDLEQEAREAFEIEHDLFMCPKVVIHPQYDWMIASLDGMDIDCENIVEIKCPSRQDHLEAIAGNVPSKYYPQLQHQLAVTGLPFAYYYSYDGKEGVTVKVPRDDEYIKNIIEKELEFYECLQSLTPPPLGKSDYTQRDDLLWLEASERWQNAKLLLNELEKSEKELRETLICLASNKSCMGGGVKVCKSIRRGTIDYKRIPEIQGIDLEKYRSESSVAWRITTGR